MNGTGKLILLSAGGTGGHMFPAAALAQDLLSRGYDVALATDERGAKLAGIFGAVPVHVLRAGTLGAGFAGKIAGLCALATGIAQAFMLLAKLKPVAVVGFGGYPSVPAVFAAQRRGIPTIIHEQNAILGRANILLAHRAERIALSLPRVQGIEESDARRAVVTGNPVRAEIGALYARPYPVLSPGGAVRIAVIGGSLGARVFADVVPQTLARLPTAEKGRLEITQQCRAEDIEEVRKFYEHSGISARLAVFFNDMPTILEQAHLVISRAGASTVSEVTTAGRPAIFVPYPYHADQQQKINADTVADAGGAWVMTQDGFTSDALLPRLELFLQNPETLFRAAEKARSCARPDAARRLGNLVTALASGWEEVM